MSKEGKGVQFDCSARFYPIISSKKSQSLYHIALKLDGGVDRELLRRAVEDVLRQYPTFGTKLKRGYAWYYLVKNDAPVPIVDFDGKILKPLEKKRAGRYLFRIGVRGDEIHIDFFHGLADGAGSLSFVLAVIKRMRTLEGRTLPEDGVIGADFVPSEEESEDAFLRYYKPIKFKDADFKGMAGKAPFRLRGTRIEDYATTQFAADGAEILQAARAAGTSVTAYVAAIAASCLEKLAAGDKKPIALMIPVNLRASFPSRTQRNFVLFVRIVIEQGKCKRLADYIAEVKKQLKEGTDRDRLEKQISTTVKGMTMPAMNVLPLCLKKFSSRMGRLFMRSRQSIIISNLGRVEATPEYGIKRLTYNLNVSKNNVQNLAITSFGGETVFSFTSAIKEDDLQRSFKAALEGEGVNLRRL